MVIKSCTYWKKCPCGYFLDSLQQNDNGNRFEINTKKLVYYTQKEGKIVFVRTQMAISYLGVVQVKNVTWIKYKWRLHMLCTCLRYAWIFWEPSLNYYIKIWFFEIISKFRPFIMSTWCKFKVPNLLLNMLSVPTI